VPRFPTPILPTRDIVQETKKQVEVPIPYKTGATAFTDEYTYVLTPPQGDRSFRYQYQDPEDEYRPTSWATGLSVTVSILHPGSSTWLLTSLSLYSCAVLGGALISQIQPTAGISIHFLGPPSISLALGLFLPDDACHDPLSQTQPIAFSLFLLAYICFVFPIYLCVIAEPLPWPCILLTSTCQSTYCPHSLS
jgi:hypothetical protein